ncbi:MAG: (2Fe-2S)-binding protein [Lysobacterales bacterium]
MYVCVCQGVTEQSVRKAVREGASTLEELGARTGCGTCCGCCVDSAAEILAEESSRRSIPLAALVAAAA